MDISYAQTEALVELLDKVELPPELNSCKQATTIRRTFSHSPTEKLRRKPPSSRSSQKKSFQLSCELFIKFSVEHTRAMPPNWAAFFYTRMQQTQTILQHDYIVDRLEAYHHYYGWFKNKNAEYALVAESLVTFFRNHLQDPDNAIIGLKPNIEVFTTHYERTADGKKYRLPRGVDPVHDFISLPEISNNSSIVSNALRMSGYTSRRKRKSKEDPPSQYMVGEIVILSKQPIWQPHALIFARVADIPDDEGIKVYCNPSETESELVPLSQVVALHPEMVENLFEIKLMQKLVSDPIDAFFNKMTEQVKENTNQFLEAHGINTTVLQGILDRSEQNQKSLSMTDLPVLMLCDEKFKKWTESPPIDFYNRIDADCTAEVDKLKQNPPPGVFQPTIGKAFTELEIFTFSQLAKNRLNRFAGNCETALGYLVIEKSEYISGKRKNELTAWWLTKIDTSARRFLSDRAYDDAAIPEDYISHPPAILDPIRKNLAIIEEILHPTDNSSAVRDMVNSLKEDIYLKINEFIANVSVIVADDLGFDVNQFSVSFAEELLASKKDDWEPSMVKCIGDIIKDVDYLLEMQEMEDPAKQAAPGGGLVLSNVVPVSGLIMSTFFRRENVLRTILELYGYLDAAPPTEPEAKQETETKQVGETQDNNSSETKVETQTEEQTEEQTKNPVNSRDTSGNTETTCGLETIIYNDNLNVEGDTVGVAPTLGKKQIEGAKRDEDNNDGDGDDMTRNLEHTFPNEKNLHSFKIPTETEMFAPLIVFDPESAPQLKTPELREQKPDKVGGRPASRNTWRLSTNISAREGEIVTKRRGSSPMGFSRIPPEKRRGFEYAIPEVGLGVSCIPKDTQE